ncbi:chromate transporter [Geobacter sp. DSM 9736]|uniref:chromate transporter n=1 Tax=Geobacter sp. DSM 9736 TaxID=1277350 RepID=UPI000B509D4E|nr:chromate transporter [Geobacter sp. DSM 9736]SNB47948.1 chromate transporter [Geobacter sp. DSM 9736]
MAGLAGIAWTFLKIGMIFFGGGYVLVPLLHRLMVDEYGWLSLKEFLDGVALSQLTPGPLAMLATFSGFRAGGFAGGLVATIAIFLPCTLLMLAISSRYEKFRSMELIRKCLDGILPAVVGLVAAAAFNLGMTSLSAPPDFLLLFAGMALLQFTRISPMVVILGAGAIGYLFSF